MSETIHPGDKILFTPLIEKRSLGLFRFDPGVIVQFRDNDIIVMELISRTLVSVQLEEIEKATKTAA